MSDHHPPKQVITIAEMRTGKAAAVRISVPRLDASCGFDEQLVAVRAGHEAVGKLLDLWIVNADRWPTEARNR